ALEVVDHALAERLLPVLDHGEVRVQVADGLVAQVEQVGVEERQVVVRLGRAGHGAAGGAALGVRVVLVLDADAPAQRGVEEHGDVPGGVDVLVTGAEPAVHHDAVGDLEPRGLGEPGVGLDAEARDHAVHLDALAAAGHDHEVIALVHHVRDAGARAYVHAAFTVVPVQEARELGREEAAADAVLGEQHDDLLPDHGERGGDLGADEPAADHREPLAPLRPAPQPAVVFEGAIVEHAVRIAGELPRRAAGGQQSLPEAVDFAGVVAAFLGDRVQRHGGAAEPQLDAALIRAAPYALERLALPQRLGERRPVVGRVRLGGDDADGAVGVHLADPGGRRVRGHPAADDEVLVGRHGARLRSSVGRAASTGICRVRPARASPGARSRGNLPQRRRRATWSYLKQPVRWSLTMPAACMNA